MEETVVVGGVVFIVLLITWGILAIHHRFLIPQIRKDNLEKKIQQIAGLLGVTLPQKCLHPTISVVDQKELFLLLPPEQGWDYVFIAGVWLKEWNRIVFGKTYDREDTFVHEVVHFLQDTCGTRAQGAEEREKEADRITRLYLGLYFPFQYFFLIVCYGVFGIWGFEIFKDHVFDYHP